VASNAFRASGTVTDPLQELRAQLPVGRMRMDSDKCDWRIRMTDVSRSAVTDASASGTELDVRASTPAFSGSMSSDKCDWSLRASGAHPDLRQRPELQAEMTSSKCDFSLRLRFGIRDGRFLRIHAVSSDKCDFRIVSRLVEDPFDV